jgi:hypothetical protein
MGATNDASLQGLAPANNSLTRKNLGSTNTLAYFSSALVTKKNSFITLRAGRRIRRIEPGRTRGQS